MVIQLKKTCGNLQKLPVAVLVGPVTGSSGEQLAIILSVRKNTILIGEPTAGYVSANNGFRLPGNENGIVIGESFTKDILGNVYKDDVQPSLFVKGGDDFSNLEKDKKIITAMDWLAGQLTRRPK